MFSTLPLFLSLAFVLAEIEIETLPDGRRYFVCSGPNVNAMSDGDEVTVTEVAPGRFEVVYKHPEMAQYVTPAAATAGAVAANGTHNQRHHTPAQNIQNAEAKAMATWLEDQQKFYDQYMAHIAGTTGGNYYNPVSTNQVESSGYGYQQPNIVGVATEHETNQIKGAAAGTPTTETKSAAGAKSSDKSEGKTDSKSNGKSKDGKDSDKDKKDSEKDKKKSQAKKKSGTKTLSLLGALSMVVLTSTMF